MVAYPWHRDHLDAAGVHSVRGSTGWLLVCSRTAPGSPGFWSRQCVVCSCWSPLFVDAAVCCQVLLCRAGVACVFLPQLPCQCAV
jgi:hypothetical protein